MEFSRVDLSDLQDLDESFSNLEIVDLVNVRAKNIGEVETQNPASTITDASSSNIPMGNPGVNYMAATPQRGNRAHDPFYRLTNSPWGKTVLEPIKPYSVMLNLDTPDFRNLEKLIDD
ncbi:hypothetical protein ACS0TY_018043 [Phlomoides rotata]